MSAAKRLTSKGQVTIPVAVRRKLGLKPGDAVSFVERGDMVAIERADSGVDDLVRWMERVKGTANLGGLTVDQWLDETRDRDVP